MSEADKEEWRDIKGYEGIYQISNLGKVKSLSRTITRKNGSKQKIEERILKPCKSKKVCQMDMDNNVINTFVSIREAEEKTGISDSNIMRCCRNIQESTHEYKFQYIN